MSNDTPSTYSLKQIIGWSIGIAGVLVTLFVGLYSIYVTWNIEKKAGAFEDPSISVFIGKRKMSKSPTRLIYCNTYPDSHRVVSHIPVAIKNTGKESLKGATLTFRFPTAAGFAIEDRFIPYSYGGKLPNKNPRRSYTHFGEIETVSYRLPPLNPGEIFTMEEPIFVPNTEFKGALPVEGKNKKVKGKVVYTSHNVISVSADNVSVKDMKLEITSLKVRSLRHFKKRVSSILGQHLSRVKDTISTFDKIKHLFGDLPNVSAISIYATPDTTIDRKSPVSIGRSSYDHIYYVDYYTPIWFRKPNRKQLMNSYSKPDRKKFPAPTVEDTK